MKRGSPTLQNIAEAVGVSKTTVSKVLNGYNDVNAATREAVLQAARDLGYPLPSGMQPAAPDAGRVAMFIEDYQPGHESSLLVYDMLMGFRHEMSERGIEVLLLSTSSEHQKRKRLASLLQYHGLRGAFLMGLKKSDPYLSEARAGDFPCVLFDIPIQRPRAGSIGVDGLRGAALAVEHLASLGHTQIAMINGHAQAFVSGEREDGYALALRRAGLQLVPEYIAYSDFTESGGDAAMENLMKAHPELTAVFCASDLMAIGAMKALRRMGLRVPEDVSVVGFDNILMAEHVSPPLTTIDQPKFQIGMLAAQLLVNLMNGEALEQLQLPPSLVVRGSTAPILS